MGLYLTEKHIKYKDGKDDHVSPFFIYHNNNKRTKVFCSLKVNNKDDKEWQKKINVHQKRRPKNWKLIETTDLLNTLNQEDGPLLIDSIGGFVMESIDRRNKEWLTKMHSLIVLLKKRRCITFIV